MLDVLRDNKRGLFSWIIILGLAAIFAIYFGGPGSLSRQKGGGVSGGTAQYAARVNGEVVGAMEFEKQVNRLFEVYRAQSGGQLTRELAVQLGLTTQALDMLIDRKVVIQEAKRRGILIPDEEVAKEIAQNQAFFVNGKFDRAAYREIARQNFGNEARFEDAIREDMLYRQLTGAVEQTVKVSPADVRQTWEQANDRVALRYVLFPRTALEAEVKPTDAEATAFAQKEAAKIQAFYDGNKARFEQKAKAKVRHVLARVAEGDAAADAAAKKRIEEAAARVQKGEDFAAVAASLSDDENTKLKGGDLGYVAEGLYDEAFVKAALALKKGEVSPPVRTQAGWHLVKADEIVPAKTTTLEEAKLQIAKELIAKERAVKLGAEKAAAALAAAQKVKEPGKQLAGFKAKLGGRDLAAAETGAFEASSEVVPQLGLVKELRDAALAASAGTLLPKVYETAAGPVVAEVVTRERPDPAKWEKDKDAATDALRRQRSYVAQQAWVKTLRDAAKIEKNEVYLAEVAPGARR
ncbi:MAG: SurA N-terminal domain-containing protein [Anaeromyxobacteraceae bacterium]